MSKNPEPFISIGAQALVKDSCKVHCGMVRKENKIKKWQDRYLVLHKGCIYYYKDSNDKTAQGQFSLSGYRLSKAPEKTKFEWVFKLTHIQPEKRAYYFAAHSEKELDEWMEKIEENMSEYCEVRRRSVAASDPSSSDDSDDQFKYDYPLVNQDDIDALIKKKIIMESQHKTNKTHQPNASTYCPPTDVLPPFLCNPKPLPPKPTFHKANAFCSQQATVDVSKVLGRGGVGAFGSHGAMDLARVMKSQPPRPVMPTKLPHRTSQSDVALSSSPMDRYKPLVPPKPHQAETCTVSKSDSTEEMYLELNNDKPENPPPRLSTLQRNRPDGNSFKSKQTESSNVLPSSAFRLDFNKTHAIPLLSGYDGAYMIHTSRKGDINQALSVCIKDKVKHFLIFANKERTEYALAPEGPFFNSIDSMLRNYYENPLPKQEYDAYLRIPYK